MNNRKGHKEADEVILYEKNINSRKLKAGKSRELRRGFRSDELDEKDLIPAEPLASPEEHIESTWLTEESQYPLKGWLAKSILIAISIIIIVGLWAINDLRKEAATAKQREQTIAKNIAAAKKEKEEALAKITKIKDCITGYLSANDPQDRANWCRNPEVTIFKMNRHYANGRTFEKYRFNPSKHPININEIQLAGKTMIVADVESNATVSPNNNTDLKDSIPLLLEKQPNGSYKVDWDTAVAYQPSDWNQFVSSKSTDPHKFRLQVTPRIMSGPYLYHFGDDSKYQAYRVSTLEQPQKFLIAYTKKGSLEDRQLKTLLDIEKTDDRRTSSKKTKQSILMTLKLAFPKNAQSNQCVEIVEIVSKSWFTP